MVLQQLNNKDICILGATPEKAVYRSRYREMYTWLYEKKEEPGIEPGPEVLPS